MVLKFIDLCYNPNRNDDGNTEVDGGPRGGGQNGGWGRMRTRREGCYVDRKYQESTKLINVGLTQESI